MFCVSNFYSSRSIVKRLLSVREVWVRIPGLSNRAQCCQWLTTAATFFRSCVAQALSYGDGPRRSLHSSASYREYNDDLIFLKQRSDPSDIASSLGVACHLFATRRWRIPLLALPSGLTSSLADLFSPLLFLMLNIQHVN